MNRITSITGACLCVVLSLVGASVARAEDAADLAKKLANPVASLISVPFQLNYDSDIGPVDDGSRATLNVQPVIPVSLNKDWNLISRTIAPLIDQQDIFPGSGSQSGLGDIVQSVFFSPVALTRKGWIWGAGPVFLLPTATDDLLGADKWGAGPTGVILKQSGPWTYGALANHIWSFAGDRDEVSTTFLQPFLTYTTPAAWSFTANSESTYDWESDQSSVPLNLVVSKVTKFGSQLVSLQAGARYYIDSTDGGPEGWGLRLGLTLLYPR
jgi:hypothetical protein